MRFERTSELVSAPEDNQEPPLSSDQPTYDKQQQQTITLEQDVMTKQLELWSITSGMPLPLLEDQLLQLIQANRRNALGGVGKNDQGNSSQAPGAAPTKKRQRDPRSCWGPFGLSRVRQLSGIQCF